jgi:hypothetical protein
MTSPTSKPRRWPRIRYSLRTLLFFTLLAGSGMGVWFKWEPWWPVQKVPFSGMDTSNACGSIYPDVQDL